MYFPKLHATFKSEHNLNFAMEMVNGLNLYQFQRERMSIDIKYVRYFTATALSMLEVLHSNSIIFRDLKPENLMIDAATANLKLVDFGFAKVIRTNRTLTKCGTPSYTAPEIISIKENDSHENSFYDLFENKHQSYGFASDIWTWGVLLCEIIGGFNPFEGHSIKETFDNIIHINVSYPRNLDTSTR